MHSIRIARELKPERALELLNEHGSIRVELADLARAWNPVSEKHSIFGPAVIEYTLWPDGGIDAILREGVQ